MGGPLLAVAVAWLGAEGLAPRLPGYVPTGVTVDFGAARSGPRAELWFRFLAEGRRPIDDEWRYEVDDNPVVRCGMFKLDLGDANFRYRQLSRTKVEVFGYTVRRPGRPDRFVPVVDVLIRSETPLDADQLPVVTPARPKPPPATRSPRTG